ncbi:hypothetical protein PIIN_05220 [Serendipita indica DSM 11827]|uniref:Uncharacterized protein n=1 Tax=Serendipita indica (strain DSM 11827) TaxID=1109443 RepID=G4TJ03_SERID|nr:hypothetical protein PIIN_05220 [Serendipita indica DSM 11827]
MRNHTLFWFSTLFLTTYAGFIQPGEEFLCLDGKQGIINYLQHFVEQPFQPAIFTIDCPWIHANATLIEPNTSTSLEKRQTSVCSTDCTRAARCYGGTGTPLTSDCQALSSYLQGRNIQTAVNGKQSVSVTSNTCLFRFTNNAASSVTWCDSSWASQSNALISTCLPQTPGGYCDITQFKLDVCLNPAAPAYTPPPTYPASSPPEQSSTANNNVASTQQSSAAGASSSSSGSSSTQSSSTLLSSSTGHSPTPTSSQSSSHEVPQGLSGGASIASANAETPNNNNDENTNGGVQRKGPGPAVIVGGVMGGIALLGLVGALLYWCRKMQQRRNSTVKIYDESVHDANGQPRTSARGSIMTESQSQTFTIPPTNTNSDHHNHGFGFGSNKANMFYNGGRVVRPAAPMSEYSTSSVNHLLGGANTGTASPLDSPITTNSGLQPTSDEHPQPYRQHGDQYELELGNPDLPTHAEIDAVLASHATNQRRRSMSARTLAQAMAPNLSEDDIHRLADSIVARMQARDTAAALASAGGNGQTLGSVGYAQFHGGGPGASISGTGAGVPHASDGFAPLAYGGEGTVYGEDPPPPWRASWNGRRPGAS